MFRALRFSITIPNKQTNEQTKKDPHNKNYWNVKGLIVLLTRNSNKEKERMYNQTVVRKSIVWGEFMELFRISHAELDDCWKIQLLLISIEILLATNEHCQWLLYQSLPFHWFCTIRIENNCCAHLIKYSFRFVWFFLSLFHLHQSNKLN